MYHFRASHHYYIPPPPTARATDGTDRHDDGFTVSRGWWGNVVGVRYAEVVHILKERERERERERKRVNNLPIFMLMVMLITKNDNNPR